MSSVVAMMVYWAQIGRGLRLVIGAPQTRLVGSERRDANADMKNAFLRFLLPLREGNSSLMLVPDLRVTGAMPGWCECSPVSGYASGAANEGGCAIHA